MLCRSPSVNASGWAKTWENAHIRGYLQLFRSNNDYCCRPEYERSIHDAIWQEGCEYAIAFMSTILKFLFALLCIWWCLPYPWRARLFYWRLWKMLSHFILNWMWTFIVPTYLQSIGYAMNKFLLFSSILFPYWQIFFSHSFIGNQQAYGDE